MTDLEKHGDDQHGDDHGTPDDAQGRLPAMTGGYLPVEEPIANPGLPEHTWRPTDVDEGAAKRAERQVSLMFLLSGVCTVLFVVAYFTLDIGDNWTTFGGLGASTLFLGLTLGGALLLIGVGIIQWARKLMADHEIVEMRHPARSSDEDRETTAAVLQTGLEESGLGKHSMIRRTLLLSTGLLAAPAVILLRDLGPSPASVANAEEGTGLKHTFWGTGDRIRVVRDVVGTPIRPADLQIGDLVNGVPDGLLELEGIELQVAKAKAAVIMVKMEPREITPGPGREDWSVDGVICYSKICSHVGCPISLYERTTHHVLCPCHQSTFDLADSAKVVFGPAGRPLPQLHLGVDDEGYLVAEGDFTEPVGPSFWDREK
ncbi:ubiquinol-cytochrome c reductase iron-sulfur subunit [Nocardioides litoris]|uniref:cytochrome bc1 complex Rieske iron-sulfur subunit n=1 Tax=Nocardioides litoris TaxID=1926648 RepID=UPI001FEAAC7A|nr:Rieske 2Fe-2S domain-containing protein [Nocardioides litoris]